VGLIYRYKRPATDEAGRKRLLSLVREKMSGEIEDLETEYCFYIEASSPFSPDDKELLRWLLRETFEPENFSEGSFFTLNAEPGTPHIIIEVGPRMNFTTAWSTNAVSVCHSCGLTKITRIERSRRYKFLPVKNAGIRQSDFVSSLLTSHSSRFYDRMTECPYPQRLETFETGIRPEPFYYVPLIREGRPALEKINR
jgi:phosphoribosylformylglycinamidine synthase